MFSQNEQFLSQNLTQSNANLFNRVQFEMKILNT